MKRIKLTITLCIVAALSGLLISSVNTVTRPIIDKNAAEKEKSLYEEIFADIDTYEKNENVSDLISEQVVIYDSAKNIIGYVYKATGVNGYGSITVLTGIDTEQKVKAIKYSAFSQTPGFGDKVKEDVFMNQFSGMPTSTISVDAQAGATYSSNLVGDVVALVSEYHKNNVK